MLNQVQQCEQCRFAYFIDEHDHCPRCGPAPKPKPKIANDIAKRRWEKATSSGDLQPIDGLHRLIADIEAGEKVQHVIVVYATAPREGEKHDGMGFYQSGPYPTSHALGLLEYGKGCLLQHIWEGQ